MDSATGVERKQCGSWHGKGGFARFVPSCLTPQILHLVKMLKA